jgi:hypothetical protein
MDWLAVTDVRQQICQLMHKGFCVAQAPMRTPALFGNGQLRPAPDGAGDTWIRTFGAEKRVYHADTQGTEKTEP